MLSERMEAALNAQLNGEFWSAYLYLSVSAYFAADGKPGFSHWFEVQAKEEVNHAMKIVNFIIDRGGKVDLKPIAEVPTVWESPLDAFKRSLHQEQMVTKSINELVSMAREEKDYATEKMLQWFVDEQVEEEVTFSTQVDALTLIGDNGFGIFTLDKELGSRTFSSGNQE